MTSLPLSLDKLGCWFAVICFVVLHCNGELPTKTCGRTPGFHPGRRIYNGRTAAEGAWPFSGRLVRHLFNSHTCSMSLIGDQWAITAAHCIEHPTHTRANHLYGIFGDWDRNTISPFEQRVEFDKVFPHPNYTQRYDDIALLHFDKAINITDYVQPICLNRDKNEIDTYDNCWFVGWGTDVSYDLPRYLREIPWSLTEADRCPTFTNTTELCGTGKHPQDGGHGCPGDSGGGLYCVGDGNRWYILGVLARGEGLCGSYRNWHTRISNYTEFIEEVISRVEECRSPDTLCSDGKTCLLTEEICNGDWNCPDGQDERDCTAPSCSNNTCMNGGKCVEQSDGRYMCECTNGYIGADCSIVECESNGEPTEIILYPGTPFNLSSPGYPVRNYTNGVQCYWRLKVPDGYSVLANVVYMSLENGFDFLYLAFVPLTGSNPPQVLTSSAKLTDIVFVTDQSVTARGFLITFSAINKTELTGINECLYSPCENGGSCIDLEDGYLCSCPDQYMGITCYAVNTCGEQDLRLNLNTTMNITSFNYLEERNPSRYQFGCTWKITAPDGRRIIVSTIDVFSLNNVAIIVIDNRAVLHYLNNSVDFSDYISDGNTVTIQYYTYQWTSNERFWFTAAVYEEPDKNECISQPCQNGARCLNNLYGFTCKCRRGFRGRLCEIGKRRCGQNIHVCDNNRCISPYFVCDGRNNCGDGTDERDCECEFRCLNGRCLPQRYVCDDNNNCLDWSDELRPVCSVKK